MKITECERGHNDASVEAIAWLHAEALRMNDPHARQILNNAAFSLGVLHNKPEAQARIAQRGLHGEADRPAPPGTPT